jgi:hypothetical protein
VAIYSRVSTANQVGGRFDSCESQAAVCRDFIAQHAHDGWFEIAGFSDPAYSGSSMNRPGVRALMRQIEAGEIKIVLIFKLERVLRSTDEWGRSAPFCQPRTRRSPLVPAPRLAHGCWRWWVPGAVRLLLNSGLAASPPCPCSGLAFRVAGQSRVYWQSAALARRRRM